MGCDKYISLVGLHRIWIYAAAIGYSMLPEGSRGAVPGIPIRSSYQAVAEYWKNAVDLLFGKNKK
jgi:hypothetical protein